MPQNRQDSDLLTRGISKMSNQWNNIKLTPEDLELIEQETGYHSENYWREKRKIKQFPFGFIDEGCGIGKYTLIQKHIYTGHLLKDLAAIDIDILLKKTIDIDSLTEEQARRIFENIRWPEGIYCPHCQNDDVTRIQAKFNKARDGLIQCNACRGQFTVTVGTIMHRSHITLKQWVQAFYSICSHKKGVSALQLQRNLGLHTYRSAWYLVHRIRLAQTNLNHSETPSSRKSHIKSLKELQR